MPTTRIINILIAVALVALITLSGQSSLQTEQVVHAAAPSCSVAMERASLQTAYVPEYHGWFPYASKGYTGLDGGLISMLSDRLPCAE